MSPTLQPGGMDKATRDRWFFFILAASTVAVVRLLLPFFTAGLFAAVVVVVSWPFFVWVVDLCRGRRPLAALLTTALLGLVVFAPLVTLLLLFVRQAVGLASAAVSLAQSGKVQAVVTSWLARFNWTDLKALLPASLAALLPEEVNLAETVAGPLQDAALEVLNMLGGTVPALLNMTFGAVLGGIIFVAAVVTLFLEGPSLLTVLRNLSPLDDAYDDELLRVFAQLSKNLVVGALGTSTVMAVVASLGFALGGVHSPLFLGGLCGLFSFVPVVGTALVWIPVTLLTFAQEGAGAGAFVLVWSVALTSNVDTLVRPMFMSGGTQLHPLIILLALLGGVAWMGAPGALLGPVTVAFFWALYTIYRVRYLGLPEEDVPPPPPPSWWTRLRARFGRPPQPPPPPATPTRS